MLTRMTRLLNWSLISVSPSRSRTARVGSEVAEQVIGGFLRAAATDKVLRDTNASASPGVTALTFLAGAKNVDSTREGIEKAIAAGERK